MTGIFTKFLEKQRYEVISQYLNGDILDLGCGVAKIVAHLPNNSTYTGIESNSEIYNWLIQNRKGYEFFKIDLDLEPLNMKRQFDTILMLAVIENLQYPKYIVSQIPNYLTQNGKLLITTPTPLGNVVHNLGSKLNLFSKTAAEEHQIIFNFSHLIDLLSTNGLKIDTYKKFLLGGNQLVICSI